jgi:hypothetical protein
MQTNNEQGQNIALNSAHNPEPTVHHKNNFAQLVIALIGFAGLAFGAYFGFSAQSNSDASAELRLFIEKQVEINQKQTVRLNTLEKENRLLTELNALQTLEIAKLKFDETMRRSEADVYIEFIHSFPVPAWIKGPVEDNQFSMIVVNAEFTARYGKTQEQLKGKTDHEVWSKEIADGFLAIDREVAKTGRATISQVTTMIDGEPTIETTIKFRIMLDTGEWGVAGFIFP